MVWEIEKLCIHMFNDQFIAAIFAIFIYFSVWIFIANDSRLAFVCIKIRFFLRRTYLGKGSILCNFKNEIWISNEIMLIYNLMNSMLKILLHSNKQLYDVRKTLFFHLIIYNNLIWWRNFIINCVDLGCLFWT